MGPTPEDQQFSVRFVRAVVVSVVLDALYLIAVGPEIIRLGTTNTDKRFTAANFAHHPREIGLAAFLLLFLVPAVVAEMQCRVSEWARGHQGWVNAHVPEWLGRTLGVRARPISGIPSAWDWVAARRGGCFVRIFTSDSRWVGGWLSDDAYLSLYPEPRDIFISVEWRMSEEGRFLEAVGGSLGLYVPLNGIDRVAWLEGSQDQLPLETF